MHPNTQPKRLETPSYQQTLSKQTTTSPRKELNTLADEHHTLRKVRTEVDDNLFSIGRCETNTPIVRSLVPSFVRWSGCVLVSSSGRRGENQSAKADA